VWVEDGLTPVQIYIDDGDTWAFGNNVGQPLRGTINRITGHVKITFYNRTPKKTYFTAFDGVCHKTEKLFQGGGER
jgi:hypothetical protein